MARGTRASPRAVLPAGCPMTAAQALATLNDPIGDRCALPGGHAVPAVDRQSDGSVVDTTLHRPVVGLALRL